MKLKLFSIFFLALNLCACSSDYTNEDLKTEEREDRKNRGMGKFFGEDTLTFGGAKKRNQEDTGLGVNSYLWRASLDTISFMPIIAADPFGGMILTDWYSPPQNPEERLKVNIFILDRQLRSDGLKVSLFRQIRDPSGHWVDQQINPQTIEDIENTILSRARYFRSTSTK